MICTTSVCMRLPRRPARSARRRRGGLPRRGREGGRTGGPPPRQAPPAALADDTWHGAGRIPASSKRHARAPIRGCARLADRPPQWRMSDECGVGERMRPRVSGAGLHGRPKRPKAAHQRFVCGGRVRWPCAAACDPVSPPRRAADCGLCAGRHYAPTHRLLINRGGRDAATRMRAGVSSPSACAACLNRRVRARCRATFRHPTWPSRRGRPGRCGCRRIVRH